jgi:hypothetical protein
MPSIVVPSQHCNKYVTPLIKISGFCRMRCQSQLYLIGNQNRTILSTQTASTTPGSHLKSEIRIKLVKQWTKFSGLPTLVGDESHVVLSLVDIPMSMAKYPDITRLRSRDTFTSTYIALVLLMRLVYLSRVIL